MKNINILLFLSIIIIIGFLSFYGIQTINKFNEEIYFLRNAIKIETVQPITETFDLSKCRIESNVVKANENGFYPGESPTRKTSVCDQNEIVISGGCEIIGQSGAFKDFGGVQNVGYIANYPNKKQNGWTCGFYGGFGGDLNQDGTISMLRETGVWDINSHAVCCPINQ